MSEEAQEIVTEGGDPQLQPEPTEVSSERPEWLPEKFKSAEDMASAYSSLEGKLGQFSEGINMYLNALNADVPDYDEEVSKLGDNANARTEAASLFANQFFPEEQLPAIERMCETAEGVMVLETIMEAMKQAGPSADGTPLGAINEQQLQQMMNDPRYHDPARRDKNFVAQVEQGFKKLYG